MEQKLNEAAIVGNVASLHEILKEDGLILDRFVLSGSNAIISPLHVAASRGHTQFVKELLDLNLDLAEVVDSRRRSALHLASAKGHVDIVKVLSANPEMCVARDLDGKNPLHVAAMKGQVEILKELVRASPQAARAKVDTGETILHLCVKHKQLQTLEILVNAIKCQELLNAKDGNGNTVLHLAVSDKQFSIIKILLEGNLVDVNATNANENTALDIFVESKIENEDIGNILHKFGAKIGKDIVKGEWLMKKRDALMVVASLIATMAFQAGVSPAGGVWQDDSNGHRAGETVMAYNYPDSFPYFLRANTIGFVASLSTILLLISGLPFRKRAFMWMLVVIMWLTITSMAFTYAFSITVVTPKKDRESLSSTIFVAVIVWCSVMAILLLVHTGNLIATMLKEQRIKYITTKRIFTCGSC
ncbi:Ankyrin repeat-containing protein [Actinidia chinensis var. chinensis]|uniref:Ankyrin repeat-containing protein n=1 Tax=Actinidia chinensis var. chinensis TaxID=1590841 RepID=A0A2R6QPC0_ACTCC|nr:Ankyrin repeat-containing protein [Actinidia chinensis var. chinensis]